MAIRHGTDNAMATRLKGDYHTIEAGTITLAMLAADAIGGDSGPHTHVESDVTSLTDDLAAKATSSHNHDATYSAAAHTHAACTPAGVIAMWGGLLANIPAGWALCNGANGTPDLRDRFVKGAANAANPGTTGGAATHTHAAHTDHAALAHSGATVGAHTFTQPGAHSAHVFTQASAHVFTQPAGHSNHVVTQPAAHADNIAHTHGLNVQGGTTAAVTGTHVMTSTATGGSARAITAGDAGLSQGTGASLTHSATAVDAHSAHSGGAVDAHAGAGVDAHSAHSGGAVDAHTVGQASQHAAQSHSSHDSPNSEPAFYALSFIQKL